MCIGRLTFEKRAANLAKELASQWQGAGSLLFTLNHILVFNSQSLTQMIWQN
jgi:hypothetical protein